MYRILITLLILGTLESKGSSLKQKNIQWFTKDDGRKLPVSDDFLLPFLTPTSPGTNYWDPPPPGNVEAFGREDGRVLLARLQ